MKNWSLLFGVAAAVGSAAVVAVLLTRRAREAAGAEKVPELIDDCFERIHRIESELRRLNPEV